MTRWAAALLCFLLAGAARADVAVPAAGCRYEIALADVEARALAIELACAGDGPHRLHGIRLIPNDHVRDLRAVAGSTLAKDESAWVLTGQGGAARAAYRFDLDDLVASTNSASIGRRVGGAVVTSPGSFLLVPEGAGVPLRLAFAAPPGAAVATALARDGADHLISSADLDPAGFVVFGRFRRLEAAAPRAGGAPPAALAVALLEGRLALPPAALEALVGEQAAALARYQGGFPVPRGLVIVRPVEDGRPLVRGVVVGGGGPTMLLLMGADSTAAQIRGHWMLMHELAHFGHPIIVEGHRWLGEGLAVYTESIVRARQGWFGEHHTWMGFRRHMARGALALTGDGLGRARTIDGVYWGGALFMLMADVEIRRRTDGRRTLVDCVKAVQEAGGVATARWELARFVARCDAGTGTTVFADLAQRHVARGTPFDLDAFWQALGLFAIENGIRYDDTAPLAAIRRALMAPAN